MTVDISNELNTIKSTQLGRTMRPALHDAIKKNNTELNIMSVSVSEFIKNSQMATPQNAEIVAARIDNTVYPPLAYRTLGERLDNNAEQISHIENNKVDTEAVSLYPISNSIPVRNNNGNVFTRDTIGFYKEDGTWSGGVYISDTDKKIYYSRVETGLTEIHTQRELPIESGTFTPYLKSDNGILNNPTAQKGHYVRTGNLIYFFARLEYGGSHNASGIAKISGLPFLLTDIQIPMSLSSFYGIAKDGTKQLTVTSFSTDELVLETCVDNSMLGYVNGSDLNNATGFGISISGVYKTNV